MREVPHLFVFLLIHWQWFWWEQWKEPLPTLFHTERRLVPDTYSMGETRGANPVSSGKGQGKMKGTAAVSLGAHLGNVPQMPECTSSTGNTLSILPNPIWQCLDPVLNSWRVKSSKYMEFSCSSNLCKPSVLLCHVIFSLHRNALEVCQWALWCTLLLFTSKAAEIELTLS